MNKILLILTGGTIGSVTNGDTIDVDTDGVETNDMADIHSCRLTDNYYDNYGNTDKVVFEIRRPLNILSENMNPVYWNELCRTIYRERDNGFDGVIIAHGSDTLSYTSALISVMYAQTGIPIILTAANHPLDADITNGNRNFAACVSYICGKNEPGVFTIYEDNSGCMNVYNSGTICEADGYLDEYHDITGGVYGVMDKGIFVKNDSYAVPEYHDDINGLCDRVSMKAGMILAGKARMSDNVMFIRPYPGMRYDSISLERYKPECILHGLYHAGTASVASVSRNNNLAEFANRCIAGGIDIYMAAVKHTEKAVYASARQLTDAGIVPMYNTNYERAYAMLVISYAV